MKFKFSSLLIFAEFLFSAQSLEHICQSGQDHCDIIGESETDQSNSIEQKISSIFDFSDENANISGKWPHKLANNASSISTKSRREIISYSMAGILYGNDTDQRKNGRSEQDTVEREYLTALREKLSGFSRPFNASRSPSSSLGCRAHTEMFFKSLNNLELWALKLYDSSARLSSGILNGNINQFGDFDQCLDVQGPTKDLRGQFCLAYMQLSVSWRSKHLKTLLDLTQSHQAFRSEFNDPGHRVPRFSLINWGLCIPSSCSSQDVEYSLKEYLKEFTAGTGVSFQVRVESNMCQVKTTSKLDFSTILAIIFFVFVLLICIVSTWYEIITDKQNQSELLTVFSLRKNSKWLFSVKSGPEDIKTVHGIRFLNALLLLQAHKSMALFFSPYINRTYMAEFLGHSWTVIARAASIYTDPFLLFSGMLTSYSLIGRLQKGHSIHLKNEYVGRFLRIVPTLGALILFCTYILPLMGSGPQWNLVIKHHSDLCKRNWWKNLLFIHNYFGFSDMCLTHTHHLGIDTELFAIAPPLILILWKWPKKGFSFLTILAAAGTAARFHTTIVNQLSNYIYFGTSIQRLFKTADYMYSSPPHRSTVYILGILLGYALRKFNKAKLTRKQLHLGWTIACVCFFGTILGPAPMGDMNYKYNSIHAAIYAAFAPIGWCAFFSWIVIVSQLGYKNKLTRILSWKGFQITTKLSYSIYLTQFPVFFFNVGRRRHIDYFRFITLMSDTNELICIVTASITLTLLFDVPFQNIKKFIFRRTTSPKQELTDQHRIEESCKDIYGKKVD